MGKDRDRGGVTDLKLAPAVPRQSDISRRWIRKGDVLSNISQVWNALGDVLGARGLEDIGWMIHLGNLGENVFVCTSHYF